MWDNSQTVNIAGPPPKDPDLTSMVVRLLLDSLQTNPSVPSSTNPLRGLMGSLRNVEMDPRLSAPEKIWAGSRNINEVAQNAAIPTMLAMRLLIEDENKRNHIARLLSKLTLASALPSIGARAADAASVIADASSPLSSASDVIPSTLFHVLKDMSPSIIAHLSQGL